MSGLLDAHGQRVLRFCVVGALNTGVDLAVFLALFYGLGWPLVAANSLSYAAGLANSYLLNSRWTFGDRAGVTSSGRPMLYAGLNLIGLLFGNLAVWTLAHGLTAWHAKLAAVGLTFAWNYWSSDRLVFARAAS